MNDRVIVQVYERVTEAEAAQEALQAGGISCTIDMLHRLNPFPSMKGQMGAITLSVHETDHEAAQRILWGEPAPEPAAATPEEERTDHQRKFDRLFRKGMFSAVGGMIFLGVGAWASIDEFRAAYRHDRKRFAERRAAFAIAMILNVVSASVLLYGVYVALIRPKLTG